MTIIFPFPYIILFLIYNLIYIGVFDGSLFYFLIFVTRPYDFLCMVGLIFV